MFAAVGNARFLLVGVVSQGKFLVSWGSLLRVFSLPPGGIDNARAVLVHGAAISFFGYMRVLHFHKGGFALGLCWGSFNSELPSRTHR